ncbi:MAG: ABC transporter ATP-binding protein [Bryobacterales bacterium]|nr:ABC transporter ATP-binding protein [Bryobacterales bacterium]
MIVFLWVLAQGTVQVIGVTSIFPFLTVAAEPDRMRESQVGKWILSALPPMDDHRLLLVSGITAIALLFISNALNLWSEVARVRYGHQFGHWLRMRLIRRITSQPYSFFLHHNSSVLLKKVTSDVYQYVNGVLLPLLDSGARLLTVALLLSLVCIVNPEVAFYAGTSLGFFYVGLFLYLNRRLRATSSGMNNAQRASWHEAGQLLSGIKPVKVHRAEEHFISRFSKHSAVQANLLSWVPVYANGPRYLVEPLAFGGLVLTILILAVQGKDFTSVIPVLGVVALAGYRLIPTLQLLYGQVAQLTTMSHHLDEVYEEFIAVEHQAASHDDPARPQRPLPFERTLTLEKVSFLYSGAHAPILKDVSLTIPKNSSVAFIGRTGCGKSTLLDLILTLQRPTSGRLLVDGKELSQGDSASWLAGIGYVPQDIFLIDDTITANIALGVREDEVDHRRLKEVCAIAQILPIIERDFPEGFQTVVGERGVRLSGGQRQRIGLARALYHRPQILILDEATSALDQATEADLVEALEPLKGTLTMLIVAHRPATVERCSVVYALESGRAVAVTHPCHPVTEQA